LASWANPDAVREVKMRYPLVVISIWAGLYTLGAAPPGTPKCSITIEPPSTTVISGAEVYVKIHLVSTGNREIARRGFSTLGPDTFYEYDCRNQAGLSVRKADLGILEAIGDQPTIKPGESDNETAPIGRTCDISQPGEYTIQISRSFADDVVVKSNTIAITVLPAAEQPQTKPGKPTFSLTLSAPKTEVALGAKIFIEIRQTNISEENIDCSAQADSGVDYNFKFYVRDQHGIEAAKVVLEHPELVAPSYQGCTLPPGESKTSGALISHVYQFGEPGEYTIQVSRLDEGNPGRFFVKSNNITITVLPEVVPPPAQEVNPSHSQPPPSSDRESHAPQATAGHPSALLAPVPEKPGFALSIQEDKEAARTAPGLHRVVVKHTNVSTGAEFDFFYKEALGMYSMTVLRDGVPVAETDAMRALKKYRKADNDYHPPNQRVAQPGESWTDALDVSDFYDMTKPGTYQITVTREPLPVDLTYSVPVRSNTITIVVPPVAAAASPPALEKPKPRFALTLSIANPGEFPVGVRVHRQNISEGIIREAKCWQFAGMYNVVVSRNGAPLEETSELRALQKRRDALDCPGNETVITINPGEAEMEDLPLDFFYDTEEPGAYTVYVTRETFPWNPAKSVPVESNTVYFVVPDAAPVVDAPPPASGAGPD
jgi:hypothetical protein